MQCVENHIAVYSPHTSYDAVKGGVNDWLVQPFGKMILIPLLHGHSILCLPPINGQNIKIFRGITH